MFATLGRMPMIAWAQTDLPEPDSPTRATVLPCGTRKETPRTAGITMPSRTKSTFEIFDVEEVGHAASTLTPIASMLSSVTWSSGRFACLAA